MIIVPAMNPSRSDRSGFSLIEVLVVVAIVAMLASVGTIQVLRARIVASEQMALTTLWHLTKTVEFFRSTNQQVPADLTALGLPAANPPYLPAVLIGDGTTVNKQGYTFTYTRVDPFSFTVRGNPDTHGVTGVRHFFTEQIGAIHFTNENRDATALDPLLP